MKSRREFPEHRVYVDVETTGVDPERFHVIEIGAVAFRDGHEISSFSVLVHPGEPAILGADRRALDVNGITPEEIRQGRPTDLVAAMFQDFLARHPGSIHAFPVDFEKGFLSRPPWSVLRAWGECVMQASRELMAGEGALQNGPDGKPKRPRLGEAAAFFGVTLPGQKHRALYDARKAGLIHQEIVGRRLVEDEVSDMIEDGM